MVFLKLRRNRVFAKSVLIFGLFFFMVSCSPMSIIENNTEEVQADRAVVESIPDMPRMTGVNWFGFESDTYIAHGLWIRDYKSMLIQMKDLGFNTIRIPFSNDMLTQSPAGALQVNAYGVDPYTGEIGLNTDLEGLTSLEVLDKIIEEAGRQGLRIVLDNHSRHANGYMEETLWYTADFTEEQWIADWVFLAEHYKNYENVVAYDINNEPHGGYMVPGMTPPATWGFDLPEYGITDWKGAAERCSQAILAVDPDICLVIQGVQDYEGSNYWWGSNHAGLKDYPITSLPKDHVFYSVHEYGPEVHSQDWFTDPTFPANLPAVWNNAFWFIYEQQLGGLLIGEIGIKEASALDPTSIPYKWFTSFLEFAGDKVHFTVWSWNPNSGDTGGILQEDWTSVNDAKYNLIKPYLEGITVDPVVPVDPVDPVDPVVPVDPVDPVVPVDPVDPTLDVEVLYADGSSSVTTNTIAPQVKLKNTGTSPISLGNTVIRYYYTSEPAAVQNVFCDHAGGSLGGTYIDTTDALVFKDVVLTGSSRYLEISFSATAPVVLEGEELSIQLRITNASWGNYDQTDDYSWEATAGVFKSSLLIPVYFEGALLHGVTP